MRKPSFTRHHHRLLQLLARPSLSSAPQTQGKQHSYSSAQRVRRLLHHLGCVTLAGAVSTTMSLAEGGEKELSLDAAKRVLRDVILELDKDEVQEVLGTLVLQAPSLQPAVTPPRQWRW